VLDGKAYAGDDWQGELFGHAELVDSEVEGLTASREAAHTAWQPASLLPIAYRLPIAYCLPLLPTNSGAGALHSVHACSQR
jgi:hypothetical protein